MTNHDDETRSKEIIEMAREAGFTDWWINPPEPERKGMCYGMLARLVEIAQAREREACANILRERSMKFEKEAQDAIENDEHDEVTSLRSTAWTLTVTAEKIMSRGKKQ